MMRRKAIDEADIPGKAKTLGIPSKAGLVSQRSGSKNRNSSNSDFFSFPPSGELGGKADEIVRETILLVN